MTVHDGVAFSHVTALRLLGVDLPWTTVADGAKHVVTRRQQDAARRGSVVAHRSRQSFLETIEIDGLLVTSPAQTFVHVAVGLPRPDDVVVLGDALMRRKNRLATADDVIHDPAGLVSRVRVALEAAERRDRSLRRRAAGRRTPRRTCA
jgi:hypothetical protein